MYVYPYRKVDAGKAKTSVDREVLKHKPKGNFSAVKNRQLKRSQNPISVTASAAVNPLIIQLSKISSHSR